MEGHKLEHFQNLGTKNETCAKFRDENNLLTKKKKNQAKGYAKYTARLSVYYINARIFIA